MSHDDNTKKFFEKLAGVVSTESDEEQNFEPQLVKASSVKERETNFEKEKESEIFDEGEGQLAIDVYQTSDDIVIEAAIAGVNADDLDLEISPEAITVKGKREYTGKTEGRDYLYQECYWGRFSRSVILPQEINPDHVSATFKNGILKIILPKVDKKKSKKVKVRFE